MLAAAPVIVYFTYITYLKNVEAAGAQAEQAERHVLALRESEERFRSVFDHAAGMGLAAESGHWIKVNRSLCEMLGYTERDLLAGSFQDIAHRDDRDDLLAQPRALGVELAIDDFGTGYSSLSYLHRFPINTLKIDRSFVGRMDGNNENAEIVRTIIMLARSLEMDVVAEGVETEDQLAQLKALNCEYGQGYFFSRPTDADGAERLLAASGA